MPHRPGLHLDLSGQKEPVLMTLDVSIHHRGLSCTVHMYIFRLQKPVLLLDLSTLQGLCGILDVSVKQMSGQRESLSVSL
jgi:hypothetical protein